MTKSLDRQVGGNHYKDMDIQPAEYIMRNGIRFAEGCVIKYVSRWRYKGGVEDLRKAMHFLEMLIESEVDPLERRPRSTAVEQNLAEAELPTPGRKK
mgnify:FL=1|tara:strand:- start:25318 stop:25608 length:291 start_codon:yes stop_codon:yes gene_type:complete